LVAVLTTVLGACAAPRWLDHKVWPERFCARGPARASCPAVASASRARASGQSPTDSLRAPALAEPCASGVHVGYQLV